jgi:type IV secretory pathway VirB10-like protein
MHNNKSSSTYKEGFPEVSQTARDNKVAIGTMVGIILLAASILFLHKKIAKKMIPPVEESYAIPTEIDLPDNQNNKTSSTQDSSTISPEQEDNTKIQLAIIQAKQRILQQRLSAPLIVFSGHPATTTETVKTMTHHKFAISHDQKRNIITFNAQQARITAGRFIHAILESAIHSDLPGFLRAIVSEPVYSDDGTQLLIPRGSRLIGQYKNEISSEQTRLFVIWTRLIMPNGISIQMTSPGMGPSGKAGTGADHINRHMWEQLGTASLLSVIEISLPHINIPVSIRSAFTDRAANSWVEPVNSYMQSENRTTPTLTVDQGKSIMIWIAQDIDFQDALKQTSSIIHA